MGKLDPEKQDAISRQLGDAYLALKAARHMGDRLRIDLAETALNDLLDRFVADVAGNKKE